MHGNVRLDYLNGVIIALKWGIVLINTSLRLLNYPIPKPLVQAIRKESNMPDTVRPREPVRRSEALASSGAGTDSVRHL